MKLCVVSVFYFQPRLNGGKGELSDFWSLWYCVSTCSMQCIIYESKFIMIAIL